MKVSDLQHHELFTTAALAEGADPATTPVADYMTAAPEVLRPDSELVDAAHPMLELGIRHLPIMRGEAIGSGRRPPGCCCVTTSSRSRSSPAAGRSAWSPAATCCA
jgi:hypothetical protein